MSHHASSLPGWLETAVFYQVYPQTFRDANADGIGDLCGLVDGLDYIQSLGVRAIWLCPCFASPFLDAGYDVSDYYAVAARYGTNADLRRVFGEADRRGIRVVLDLVAGHTSLAHPWFQNSARHAPNEHTDWYIWTDSAWSEPCGQSVVRGLSERDAGYVPNFFYHQPALNYGFAHPDPGQRWQQAVTAPGPTAVRREMRNIMRFWLDQGASGFRVDMASSLVKNDPGSKATSELWRETRAWLAAAYPDACLVSEWSYPSEAIAAGFHVDFYLHFRNRGYTALFRKNTAVGDDGYDPYGCSVFDRSGRGDVREFLDDYARHLEATRGQGYIAVPSGNHDIHPRLAAGRSIDDLKVVFLFLLSLPGVPFVYYGDEIGMVGVEGLPSVEGAYDRTVARTPMQWDHTANAGFSRAPADRLYLPVETDLGRRTVAAQDGDPESLLATVRRLVRVRSEHLSLAGGATFEPLLAKAGVWPLVFARAGSRERAVVALNPTDRAAGARVEDAAPAGDVRTLYGPSDAIRWEGGAWLIRLPPVTGAVVCAAS